MRRTSTNYKDKNQEVTTSLSHLYSSYGELVKGTSFNHLYSRYGELVKGTSFSHLYSSNVRSSEEIIEDVKVLPNMMCKVELQDKDALNAF